MPIVRPGAEPPRDGNRTSTWMIIDDTGSPAVGRRPWQAAVAVPHEPLRTGTEAMSGLDAALLRGITGFQASALVAAMGLPVPDAGALTGLSGDTVGVAGPGVVSFPLFFLTGAETAALSASLRGDEQM